jgi:hypothetical protein
MTAPIKVRIGVQPEAQPVVDALCRLHVDIGSIHARKFFPSARMPEWARFMCVAVADEDGVLELAGKLRRELAGNDAALRLCNKVLLDKLPLDTVLMVFLDIAAIEAPA